MIAATITVRVHVLCNSGEPTANATITKLRSYSEQNFDGIMLFSLAVLAAQHSQIGAESSNVELSSGLNLDRYCVNGTPLKVMPSVRAAVGITCILSMIGATLIVLSYVLIKDIRTKAREILVNLSLMDFMAAAANFTGVVVNFNTYLLDPTHPNISSHQYHVMNNFCKSQAFFAMYGTISSVLWTICIAIYVFLRIMLEGHNFAQKAVYCCYAVSYGVPFILSLWFVLTGKLGYAPYGGSGWCSVIVYNSITKERLTLNAIFANDIWIYLTIVLVPLIIISLKFYLRYEMKTEAGVMTKNMASTVQKVEMKLLFIPIFFILLRIWSLLLTIIEIEVGKSLNCTALLFFLHIGGIGDSGQGFANAILFVLFTPKVRRYFLRLFLCSALCRTVRNRSSINNRGKSKVFYGAVQSPNSEHSRTDLSDDDSPDTSSRDNEINPHSVLLNHNT